MKKNSSKKRIIMAKAHKRLGIAVIIIILLANIGLITKELLGEELMEETQTIATFSNTPGITYQVHLLPNILYNDTVLPEDQGYFTNIIDYISVTMQNKYIGVSGAEVNGDYTIIGEIIGWEAVNEDPAPAWTKQFSIVTKKKFSTTDKEFVLSQNTNINLNHFNEFVGQVDEVTEYTTAYTMKISMLINYTITTKDGELTETLQPAITIPLGDDYFKIAKTGNEEKISEITKVVEVTSPVDFRKLILFSIFGFFTLVALYLVLFKTAEPTPMNLQTRFVKKLLKENGKRLVAVHDNIVNEALSICNVHSMNDMIKISDEIERPILYVFQNDLADIKEFFIIESEKAYLYQVSDCHDSGKKKKDSEKSVASSESGDSGFTVTA